MQKNVSFFPHLLFITLVLFCCCGKAESQPKVLVPKTTASPVESPNEDLVAPNHNLLRPKKTMVPPAVPPKTSTFESISFSALLGTPSIYENFYEKRFSAFGNFYLFSLPLTRLTDNLFLHLETGPGFTYSKLTFETPPQSFTHLYLVVPAKLRLIYSVSKYFHLEGFAGVMLRPIEHDSRQTSDGGTHSVKDSNFMTADAGLGLDYNLSAPLKIRVLVGYLFIAGGLELTL